MTEPTIACPNCKTEIKLTESLAAPLIESTRQQFEKQLAQQEAKREAADGMKFGNEVVRSMHSQNNTQCVANPR